VKLAMRSGGCALGVVALACLVPFGARAERPFDSRTEVDGKPGSWDPDLSCPFSIAEEVFGFPGYAMPGIQSLEFVIPGISNPTSSAITAQVYASNNYNDAPDGKHRLLVSTQNNPIPVIPLTGCIITIQPDSTRQGQPIDVDQTCTVTPTDNAKLISLGIVRPAANTQSFFFGFGAEANNLVFPSFGSGKKVDITITTTPPATFTFVSAAGSLPAAQSYTVYGFTGTITPTPATSTGGNWLTAVPNTSTTPPSVTIGVKPSGLAPGAYTGTVTIATEFGGSVIVPVNFNVLPNSIQFVQHGGKLVVLNTDDNPIDAGGMEQGLSVKLSQDGNTALVGAPADISQTSYGGAWLYSLAGGQWGVPSLNSFPALGQASQGTSVAMSSDGSVLLSGGPNDNGSVGAAWVSGGPCAPNKLSGSGASGSSAQGSSVALSGDGLTAAVGGPSDNNFNGAVWIFTCKLGHWAQQTELVANNTIGPPRLGTSVALSVDGNTLLAGGPGDNNFAGAPWVFVRSNGVWSAGLKLAVNDNNGVAYLGGSVAVSADGNTALIGGRRDANFLGAAWVFTRSGSSWTQQGSKLVGSNSVSQYVYQGDSVALSADGNTAAIGAFGDNSFVGAAWIFQRSNGHWTQLAKKLTGSDAVGNAEQSPVSLSGSGGSLLLGGFTDNSVIGAAWSFVLSGPAPTLITINPNNAVAGSASFTLTVNGTNFLNGAAVQWNTTLLSTTPVSPSQLTATVPSSLLVAGGSIPISVVNPDGTPTGTLTFTVQSPVLAIASSHTGSFAAGENNVYSLAVSNAAAAHSTSGTVTVTDIMPAGMTLVSMAGPGWTCPNGGPACSRSDPLAGGSSYPPLAVIVAIDPGAATPLANQAVVSGGLSASAAAFDSTVVVTVSPCDVNADTSTNVPDVQLILKEALGINAPARDPNADGKVNLVDVQLLVNAALNRGCFAH